MKGGKKVNIQIRFLSVINDQVPTRNIPLKVCSAMVLEKLYYHKNLHIFVAVPRNSLTGLQSTITTLPCTDYKTEVLNLSLPA